MRVVFVHGAYVREAAAGIASVRHLLLISSYLPEVGQSLSDFGDCSPTRSCRTATPGSRRRRRITSRGRACR